MGMVLWACMRGLNTHCLSRSLSFFTDSSWTWKPWYWGERGGSGVEGEERRAFQNLDPTSMPCSQGKFRPHLKDSLGHGRWCLIFHPLYLPDEVTARLWGTVVQGMDFGGRQTLVQILALPNQLPVSSPRRTLSDKHG